jgi:hypothetical protein
MRKIFLAAFLFPVIACGDNDSAAIDDADTVDTVLMVSDADLAPPDRLMWISDFDTVNGEFFLHQQRKVSKDSLTPAKVIGYVNAAWDNIVLEFDRIGHDTIYVNIPESEFLGQQMGSAGAQAYMASTTYNLTELRGVQYVHYSMSPGDHVSPGTFSRKSFENYR